MTAQQRLSLGFPDARRLLARHHGRQGSLATVIQRLGTIQFDPLAPLGTNPDLVLQSRVPGYRQGDWQDAAYRRRLLVDGWDKQASLIPPDQWWLKLLSITGSRGVGNSAAWTSTRRKPETFSIR